MKIAVDGLADAIMSAMEEYASDVESGMKEDLAAVAKESAKELRETSPVGAGSKKGHYQAGWTYKKDTDTGYSAGYIVYNKKKPGLTHLLENGHAKKGGGRVGPVVHIAPVEQEAAEELIERLKRRLSK